MDSNTPGRLDQRVKRRPPGEAAWGKDYQIKTGRVTVRHYPPSPTNPFASDHGEFYAYAGDKAVGWLNANEAPDGRVAFDVEVDVDHRRIGVATALLKAVADRTGRSPVPSSHIQGKRASGDAEALWGALRGD
jgi:GNAT superfamily N-acetyltransferase